jgi:hypothetical protein
MNRLYLIVPVLLLAIFGGLYWQHSVHAEAEAKAKAAVVAEAKAAEETKKAEAERLAREDAERRTAARVAEEQKKEAEKHAKWEADGARIAEETTRFTTRSAEIAAEITALEAKINQVLADKDKVSRANFDEARAIELARIAKRNAEMEIQRMTEMVARKAGQTSLVNATP